MATNPRWEKRTLRKKYQARFKAMNLPCALCGRPIDYAAPSDPQHPNSFVIDEIIPISRYKEFGYASPAAAAQDWNNLQPAHYACNAAKGNKLPNEAKKIKFMLNMSDGDW